MADHSRLSASASHRWLACPGSVRLSASVPPTPASKYAAEGTAAHKLGEVCLSLGCEPADFIGQEVEGFEVTEEMAEAVDVYVKFVRSIAPDARQASGEIVLNLEVQFTLPQYHKDLAGTSDCVAYYPERGMLVVADYKHGAGVPVDPTRNSQLMIYALGAYSELIRNGKGDVKQVRIVVVQPRARNGEPVKDWWLTIEELLEWGANQLKAGAAATDDPKAPLYAGEHCRFCPAMAVCQAQMDRACQTAAVEFSAVPNPPAIESLPVEKLAQMITFSEILSEWADKVKAHAQSLAERGTPIPGWKLVPKRSNRKWKDESVASKLLGEAAFEKKLLSPAKAEAVAKKLGVQLPEDAWEKPDNGLVLVPESDKRESVKSVVALEFADTVNLFQ